MLLRDKVESTTDPEARLYKKATADKAVPSYQGHALMENRNGLVVAAEASQSATVAEREVALKLLDRTVAPKDQRMAEQKITLGADTQFQEEGFVQGLRDREVAAHVSEYVKGNLGKNSLSAADRSAALDQPAEAQVDRARIWLEQADWSATAGEAARAQASGLVLPADHRRL